MRRATAGPCCRRLEPIACSRGCRSSGPGNRTRDGMRRMVASDGEKLRLDEAARAGWLYFIAGHTQDEIAKMLQISRASAQRLVSLCLAERLITFRLEHPIAACMELAAHLKDTFKLAYCEVVPSDPAAPHSAAGIAERAANVLEQMLRSDKPVV